MCYNIIQLTYLVGDVFHAFEFCMKQQAANNLSQKHASVWAQYSMYKVKPVAIKIEDKILLLSWQETGQDSFVIIIIMYTVLELKNMFRKSQSFCASTYQ